MYIFIFYLVITSGKLEKKMEVAFLLYCMTKNLPVVYITPVPSYFQSEKLFEKCFVGSTCISESL